MLTKEQAIAIGELEAWKELTAKERVKLQLFGRLCCMPIQVFIDALSEVLGRPVYTHELALDWRGLEAEFLGQRRPPTTLEILDLIPVEKRILVEVSDISE